MKKPRQPVSLFLLAFALCLSMGVAHAAPGGAMMKGSTLTALCNSEAENDQFACQSYIAGVIDYHHLIRSLGSAPTVDFCVPEGTTMARIKDVVLLYIAHHSEHQDFIAAPGVAMSLYNAFRADGGGNFNCSFCKNDVIIKTLFKALR